MARTPVQFVAKWERATLNEKATAQEHFLDLCGLLNFPTPNTADPDGSFYRFEKPLTKVGGGAGFADVWHRGRFAWEYKTKGKYPTLQAAYQQLLLYRGDLENPPILVACDIATYEIHIDFTGYGSRVERFTNADLATARARELLHQAFTNPELLRPVERAETITQRAATRFADIARLLEGRGFAPAQIAPFFMKVLFALFAEDIQLLPAELMSQSIKQSILTPKQFPARVQALFRAMREGGYFGMDQVPRFNGGLFDDDEALPLNADEIQFLGDAARLDWSQVEPAIFGTLFERSLDPQKRAQLGAHYTSRDDILLLVEPVLMAPLRREWAATQQAVEALRPAWDGATGATKQRLRGQLEGPLFAFMERLAQTRVLDPACGSGNFLYVALTQLKDLEKEVRTYAAGVGLAEPDLGVTPAQFYGIEKNLFAAELAQVVIWIGYLQWKRANGFWDYGEPILQTLDTIQCRDAILGVDLHGQPVEPEWPEADVIVGNPPFLGDKRMRSELGDRYVEAVRKLYEGRVPGGADLVTYWFERARALIERGEIQRVGLLATNSIRNGANRKVLDRIKQTGDIFMAWGDRPWVLNGAAVRVSIVGFDNSVERERQFDGQNVTAINANLTISLDVTKAEQLVENIGIVFLGPVKGGPFEIDTEIAFGMLKRPINLSGRPNSDVVRRFIDVDDIVDRPIEKWTINFGTMMDEAEAALYEEPFEYVKKTVKPKREHNRRPRRREKWWIYNEPAPNLEQAMKSLKRCIVTPEVSKHRLFAWIDATVVPDHKLHVFAREDDYFFGVLHSRIHEVWSLAQCSWLGVGNDPSYSSSRILRTYPFPWPPGHEPQDDPRVEAIAAAARDLVAQRDAWLNPRDLAEGELKKRTLTNLYNQRPDWLAEAHQRLDRAVLDAYGWPHDLSDEAILGRLLALNTERAAGQGAAPPAEAIAEDDTE